MTRCDQARFGLRGARRARHRPDCGSQADEIQPLALEPFRRTGQPILDRSLGAALERNFNQTGVAPVKAAQQVHGVGKVAAGVTAGRFEQHVEIGMASAALARDARELGFGNADRMGPLQSITLMGTLVADGPVNRHSSPLGLVSGEALFSSS